MLPGTRISLRGPVTRGGCEARLHDIRGSLPGLFRRAGRRNRPGRQGDIAIASVIEAKDEAEVQRIIDQIPILFGASTDSDSSITS